MSIGENKVIKNLVKLNLYGNDEGKIDIFGGNIVRGQVDYFTKVIFSLDKVLYQLTTDDHKSQQKKPSDSILKEIANKSAFFMMGNIMISKTWEDFVLPIINSNDDWVLGAVSTLNSFGLGKFAIKEFESDKKLSVSLHESYEAHSYFEYMGEEKIKYPTCYTAGGLLSSIMALVYDVKLYEGKKNIDNSLYKKCFNSENPYSFEEVRCKAVKKDFCEFIIKRTSDN